MVNKERLRKKIPELLVDGPLTNKKYYNEYVKIHRRLKKLSWYQQELMFKDVEKALKQIEAIMNL